MQSELSSSSRGWAEISLEPLQLRCLELIWDLPSKYDQGNLFLKGVTGKNSPHGMS